MMKFKPSKHLSESENHELETLESLIRVAPLPPASAGRYNELVTKAHRKPRAMAEA